MPRKTRYAGVWTAEQFQAAIERHPRLGEAVRAALARVLVEGLALETAAAASGLSRQRVFDGVRRLVAEQLPAGWETGVVSLPAKAFARVRAMEAAERAKIENERPVSGSRKP